MLIPFPGQDPWRDSQASLGLRILVLCRTLGLVGGLLRFERVGRELARLGHSLAFARMSATARPRWMTSFEFLSVDEAMSRNWDMTFVPGTGFSPEMIEGFSLFAHRRYGRRVQHVLNGPFEPRRNERFLLVNKYFKPDVVIFNNRYWEPEMFAGFQARSFAFLEGAVDTRRFTPDPIRRFPGAGEPKVIGGLANKNPKPLIEALRLLPEEYTLRLFGDFRGGEIPCEDLLATGKLELTGPIADADLPRFYRGVHCVVHTETTGGWANLAAEALAGGIPLIATKYGTLAFARQEETALLIEPTAEEISGAVLRIFSSENLAASMTVRGREVIEEYDWSDYARRLLEICLGRV